MSLNSKQLFFPCFFAAVGLLVGGFVLANFWQIVPTLLILVLFWWIAKRYVQRWLSSMLLVVCIGIAAGGVLFGVSPAIMVASGSLMLVSWELAGKLDQRSNANHPLQAGFPERSHFTLLALSVGTGLLIAEAGLFIHLSLPFSGMILPGMITLFGLHRFYQIFRS